MGTMLHTIKAYLYKNYLTKNPNDYMARVSSERSVTVKDICASAASRGGADISAAAMEHGVNLFLKEMSYQLCDGYSVNTGYFTAGVEINGVFDSPTETFNPEKHSVYFKFNQGDLLRKEIPTISVDVLGVAETGVFIGQVTDVKTGSVNDLLTPNRNLIIVGDRLKLAGTNPDVGVYFIDQDTGVATKVDPTDVVTNNPSELIIVIPTLSGRKYKVEVKTQFSSGSTLLKEPRSMVFDAELTVD
jgi:hypothetical protein